MNLSDTSSGSSFASIHNFSKLQKWGGDKSARYGFKPGARTKQQCISY